ncbi:hypothetical protein [Paludisphaera borealis]|uniref:Lipocalin-like domain-containing protein n=1 Tax=Paludisphaera borealis TaxID=1387353 RepID=A0A1U7CRH0_9BACT|nr:hypothetical protein [Paludisphaera borealis]APW61489.1 hypothetical protein BSF38_03004 [Paludisphaera borealis]
MLCATIGLNVISLVLAAFPAPVSRADDALKAEDLVGGYEIVSGEKFGVKEPDERIKGSTVQFTKDRVVVMDKEEKEVYGATYELKAGEHGVGKITLTSKLAADENQIAQGLIEKKGDKVRLIYALPGGEIPREFKTKDKQLLFVLKKHAD